MQQDLRQPDRLLPEQRRLRSSPRGVNVTSSRFSRKRETDQSFVFPESITSWKAARVLVGGTKRS